MSFDEKESRFDIHEFETDEKGRRVDPEARVKIPQAEIVYETSRQRRQRIRAEKENAPKKYNWAFFLASFFCGLAVTATLDIPGPLFVGLGLGFLFFVDPIYERAISFFDKE